MSTDPTTRPEVPALTPEQLPLADIYSLLVNTYRYHHARAMAYLEPLDPGHVLLTPELALQVAASGWLTDRVWPHHPPLAPGHYTRGTPYPEPVTTTPEHTP